MFKAVNSLKYLRQIGYGVGKVIDVVDRVGGVIDGLIQVGLG